MLLFTCFPPAFARLAIVLHVRPYPIFVASRLTPFGAAVGALALCLRVFKQAPARP